MEAEDIGCQYLKTYVKHNNDWFFVSTINRRDSTEYRMMVSETMAWKLDKNNQTTDIIAHFSGAKDSSTCHFMCAQSILEKGNVDNEDSDDYTDESDIL